ncbi:hypothetical protein GX48_07920 [Paracoccidioides brasiliensis]|nr:hypothetical protein GX48_07920 [Paracoccidioides brasiliensis]
MDLLSTIPDFPTKSYSHILPSLEKANVSVKDLVLFDPLEIAKQAKVAVTDVRALAGNVITALHHDLGLVSNQEPGDVASGSIDIGGRRGVETYRDSNPRQGHKFPELSFISTLDPVLDAALAGGISTGYITEFAGESGSGKTQFLLHLLLSVQLPPPYGTSRKALYFSTESDLPTGRLSQLLDEHPLLSTLPEASARPSLENILSITTIDLETQDHILNYQIPVAVSRYNIGLVVIDSITANYRAESDSDNIPGLLARAWQLKKLGRFLRNLAAKENIAIVVANQVSDQIQMDDVIWADEPEPPTGGYMEDLPSQRSSQQTSALPAERMADVSDILRSSPPNQLGLLSSPVPSPVAEAGGNDLSLSVLDLSELLKLDYQRPFFTGWGDSHATTLDSMSSDFLPEWKTPALGIVWTNQIDCRVVLKIKNVRVSVQDTKFSCQRTDSGILPSVPSSYAIVDKLVSDHHAGDQPHTPLNPKLNQNNTSWIHTTDGGTGPEIEKALKEQNPKVHLKTAVKVASDSDSLTTPTHRKRRTIQVVFSPWTSGDPHQTLDHDKTGATAEINMVEFDPTVDEVGFEIYPSGIRGIIPGDDD